MLFRSFFRGATYCLGARVARERSTYFSWLKATRAASTFTALATFVRLTDTSRITTNISFLSQVIVRLDLYDSENDSTPKSVGSGFFLNIPGAGKDVIVTAGHNLVRPPKPGQPRPARTEKIGIWSKDAHGKWTTQIVKPTQYRIAEPYERSPTTENSIHDYGVILLDRGTTARDAFGYNIALASMDLNSKLLGDGAGLNAIVGGYPATANSGEEPELETGFGRFTKNSERQLHYSAPTDQGMSGGPVWVDFGGEPVAVGIHNYHGDKPGEGNRATRLEINTMRDIHNWAEGEGVLMRKAIRLLTKEFEKGLEFPDGVFLQIGVPENSSNNEVVPCFVFSGPNRDHSLTNFEIIQAQAYTYSSKQYGVRKTAPKVVHYIISHALPQGEQRYLEFNTNPSSAPSQVTAVKDVNFACLVEFKPTKSSPNAGKSPLQPSFEADKSFKMVVAQSHDSNSKPSQWKLLASPHDIPPPDDPFGLDRVRPGLLMNKLKERSTKFEDFILDD
ncbi:hypothetical protein BDZ91DRAFT_853903 [Kalaharituber pfeilii]|nr:hypothetical protein BDZ91DRAFT_853903 [Kalaharituber pfeilii]